MPAHDWTRVDAGLFHHFHQSWTVGLTHALNGGGLPENYFALVEQSICGQRSEEDLYAARANRVTVRHRHGDVVAVIEIISPGNKSARAPFRALVEKSAELIRQGVNLLVVDLFPPGPRDPFGLHKAIWDEFLEEDFEVPENKRLLAAAYDAGPPRVAYVEPFAVGDAIPEMPIFLALGFYVPAPLAPTYEAAWREFPEPLRRLLDDS
ncbi:MAG: DUF4058 family protein [Planctomycetes bacterium]|nr:DUF4058 family protein [Planctomycetota bacterium]